ncbi:hypothetical protein HNQ93_003602 [Hymenobacter luteus]|uniref:Lipoprotein n=2 Tax=Hymenobacter TaxID=89966 RepID=A0A7W9WEI3_9BACT|nr:MULTISPECIES: hypothetical protein [Hymenobacter]MBB4602835.1 hypothetical protein [Hymenobacter latericoloratus]MBB6060727.1 hypothetical protein [Hymenobacter luteus]
MSFFRSLPLLLLLGVGACTGAQTASESRTPATDAAAPAVALDVPTLVGRNIDQVRRALGPPREARDQKVGAEPTAEQMKATKGEDWINTFEHNGVTVVATFNARTRKVRDLVLVGTDEDEILQKGNLSLTATQYMVLPVISPSNNREIIGMRVLARK